MKRCVFAGPSVHGMSVRPPGIEFRPPAARGDIVQAVKSGVGWIGLIDGYFGSCASVWHKEILYALDEGCHVWGAASMGALRAAECHPFGMRPVGAIAMQFATGELNDDAEVAIVHGPAEVDHVPFTEALVDVRETVAAMLAAGRVTDDAAKSLLLAARQMHFAERTLDAILARAAEGRTETKFELEAVYEAYRVRAKQRDAWELVSLMASTEPIRVEAEAWDLCPSASLKSLVERG